MNRYILVDVLKRSAPAMTGTNECLSYFDLMAPAGELLKTCLEPIGDEL